MTNENKQQERLREIDELLFECQRHNIPAISVSYAQLKALRATVAVPEVFCVGRVKYPPRGGNVGLQWHVVGVADVPYRTCVPKDGELLFVLAASKGTEPNG